ncbi:MAG TPA: response regulator [Stellaceae bacterium]|nr:response regulator [Stellaceae bacterium]
MVKAPSCILVVDDLDDVRDTAVAVLSAAGYVVVAAADGEAALALLGGRPEPELLFTDVVLGRGLNGFELAQRAVRLRPRLKILYATGYAWNLGEQHDAVPGSRMLHKPYRAVELLRDVDELLEEPAPAIAPPDHEVAGDAARQAQAAPPAVLVVEDDRRSRGIAIELFTGLGLAVFAAGDGYDALALLAKHPEIAVLFSDIRLPGIDGVELARAARELRPDLQVVLTSAYVNVTAVPGMTFIAKPWQTADFSAVAGLIRRQ